MKVEITGFVHWREFHGANGFSFFQTDMSAYGYVKVCPTTLELEIPDDFDPIAGQVEVLKQQRVKVLAEFQARVNEIDDALAKLTCIEFVSEVAA